ncbi:MAG TPA: SRPBCC family protein [Chitinophagaceae bacterium]|nr:SRPBCC family protein [Chitinophagaceae bacterium]
MKRIELHTFISAPAERCFLLSLSVDLHLMHGKNESERVAEGRTSGILREGETITWEAKHFGFRRKLTAMVSGLTFPRSFFSRQLKGPFKKLEHIHLFESTAVGTRMTDIFEFEAPLGILGKLAEELFLEKHMRRYLEKRNTTLRKIAESNLWINYLKTEDHEALLDSQMA